MDYREYRNGKIIRYLDSLKYGWRKFPPSLQIALTDKCYNHCSMCGHWKREKFYTAKADDLLTFLSMGRTKGLETVCYSGGDPFAYPLGMLKRVLRWHVKNFVRYGFITSGYLRPKFRKDKELLTLLARAAWIRVSLDAVSEPIYSKIRGGVKVQEVIDSVRLLSDEDCRIGLGITVQKANQHHLSDIMEFAYGLRNVNEVRCWVVRENPDKVPDDVAFVSDIFDRWANIFKHIDVDDNLEGAKRDLVGGEGEGLPFGRCYACLYQMFIDASGEVFPCCIIGGDTESNNHGNSFGNIYKKGWNWRHIWNRAQIYNRRIFKDLPDICQRNCITRLRTINCYAAKHWNEKHFL
jgi:MoaA/NifB/PqqE/SkfB family radical SAM enzyme